MYHWIRHQTKFRYARPVTETVMELRLQPRTEWTQHCLSFDLQITPKVRVQSYRDSLGNTVHHFTSPGKVTAIDLAATSLVEVAPFLQWPAQLGAEAWGQLDAANQSFDYYEMVMPSEFAKPTALLAELAAKLHVTRRDDPMTVLRQINRGIHEAFEYTPRVTRVDSPIDDALRSRKGVCQDFAHIMITLVRQLRIPCRYVSGYIDSPEGRGGHASHAWVEALLPGWGWVGFDPARNELIGEGHIRCAVGRDYADVPPTKGVYKGDVRGELSVHVAVKPTEAPERGDSSFSVPTEDEWFGAEPAELPAPLARELAHQRQQQQ